MTVNGFPKDPLIIEDDITTKVFEEWFGKRLLPQLLPGQIVVMDNATIHHSENARALCVEHGLQLDFLPPYLPVLNPIEPALVSLKAWVKQHLDEAVMFRDFGAFLHCAFEIVGEKGGADWFKDGGYEVEVNLEPLLS